MRTTRNPRRMALVAAAAALTFAAIPGVLSGAAAGAATTPMYTSVYPTHTCADFGSQRGGDQGAQCADLVVVSADSSGTRLAGQGQSFCHAVTAPNATVQCRGIKQVDSLIVIPPDGRPSVVYTQHWTCGNYGGAACPGGGARFENISPQQPRLCGRMYQYQASVQTTLVLPSGATEESDTLSTVPDPLC